MLMKTFESRRSGWEHRPAAGWMGGVVLTLVCAIGCGPAGGPADETGELTTGEFGSTTQDVSIPNGLSLNGLSLNGLSLNGLSLNGLSLNGLSTSSFRTWFQADPAVRDEVMRYVVTCAVPAGQTRTFTDSNTNITYTWNGGLGLATSWAGGSAATTAELQVVSACMAAHANKFGIHVNLSLLGLDGAGNTIPYTSQELTDYGVKEGCFFGNLFDGSTGTFGANDGLTLTSSQSSPRVCALSGVPNSSQCVPMTYVGNCSTYCTRDSTNTYYTSCTYNGVTYRPITTRMKAADIYSCGDGTCQATEKCGTGNTPSSCAADCHACP
ncbi:hypothetical protein [Vitiosangium sp. GDMCC 1.1324]|uniref:hypothetical protein n=1 Tax=Vitiosangium sp. (strain GDMCC 1.1324) TaxID=2138576 RepID=UPI000D386C5D|nr:hypothetical protein [Vitiosangium sp. GDMCC 1.1324]PTL81728.1 hypothetical protein DAT35_22575 [Vitiosangium sp. GDMCC 1.1324]